MYKLNFLPYIGKDYHVQSPKLVILGESHYLDSKYVADENLTRNVVKCWALREEGKSKRFFTLIAKIIDPELTNQTTPTFWEKVAFYNFVQVIVGEKPGIRPTDDMFMNSNQAFINVLEQLKPDIVVVLGKQLSGHLSKYRNEFAPFITDIEFCLWTHPSAKRHFKAQLARNEFVRTEQKWSSRDV